MSIWYWAVVLCKQSASCVQQLWVSRRKLTCSRGPVPGTTVVVVLIGGILVGRSWRVLAVAIVPAAIRAFDPGSERTLGDRGSCYGHWGCLVPLGMCAREVWTPSAVRSLAAYYMVVLGPLDRAYLVTRLTPGGRPCVLGEPGDAEEREPMVGLARLHVPRFADAAWPLSTGRFLGGEHHPRHHEMSEQLGCC